MENKDLFQKVQNGYNCNQVEQYITVLKAEYKKVFEYAKENGIMLVLEDFDDKIAYMRELKEYFIDGIRKIEKTVVHGRTDEMSAPHIISVGFAGIRSEVLLHTLEDKGIYVSAGSACASNHPAISGVLRGIGVRSEYLDSTLRFSMSEFTTKEEIDYTLKTLYNCVPMLRRYTRY